LRRGAEEVRRSERGFERHSALATSNVVDTGSGHPEFLVEFLRSQSERARLLRKWRISRSQEGAGESVVCTHINRVVGTPRQRRINQLRVQFRREMVEKGVVTA
jgi:hypothetical protein